MNELLNVESALDSLQKYRIHPGSFDCVALADAREIIVNCGECRDCQHYTPPPADPRFARFGEAMWKYITDRGGDFCGEEISEDILPLAQNAGLCCRVEYDHAIHGEGIEADPGSEIWYWGNERSSPARP